MTCLRVVTGASGRIGTALTRHLARFPGTLLPVDTHHSPDTPVHPVDITSSAFADLLAERLDGATRAELYHTAGHVPGLARITDTPTDDFTRTLCDNLTTTYTALRTYALTTQQAGVPACAVLLSSVGATRAHRYLPAYDAAKAATESLVRSFTLEFGTHLAVRAVALGPLAQSATTAADGDRAPALVALVPRGAYADLDDTAAALATFGHPCFDTATGHTLTLDGGLSTQLRPAAVERPPADPGIPPPPSRDRDTGAHRSPTTLSGGPR